MDLNIWTWNFGHELLDLIFGLRLLDLYFWTFRLDFWTETFSRVSIISVLDLDFWTWTFKHGLLDLEFSALTFGLLDLDLWTWTFGLGLLYLWVIFIRVTLQLLGVNVNGVNDPELQERTWEATAGCII